MKYYLSRGCPPIVKGWAIWQEEGNKAWPVLYLRKPTNQKQKDWEKLVPKLLNMEPSVAEYN